MLALSLINRYSRALISGAAAKGYDYASLCRSVQVQPEAAFGTGLVFGPEAMARLSREVKEMMQDDFCGLTSSRCRHGTTVEVWELILPSETLADALDRGFRLYALLSDDIHLRLDRHNGLASIQMSLAHPEMDRHHFLLEWWPLIWQRYASWLIGEEIPILAAEFPHPQSAPAEEYAQVFSSDCRFQRPGPDARLSFDSRYLARRVIRGPRDVQALVASTKRIDLVSVTGIEKTLKTRVKAELHDHFCKTQRFLSMEEIASEHCMSSQTLRRRLEEEGASYRQVKEEIRREVVMKWLANPELPIGEVSRLGGFAEANGLTRAVKTWTGLSPKAYRNRALEA